ncbi:hypothetical protein LAZ67_15000169 [Cordylochernes scorpioides]|uniref:Toll-like receptor 5 n=1 Tax=Cordylochernes scorpioides TaxID=51811 RepID=A0ABY6LAF4_9ARAC|nr:hypothetical protein LAZ67_15000169 [Cordylochernes scorpioides]
MWLNLLAALWASPLVTATGEPGDLCPSPNQLSPCTCGGPATFILLSCDRIPDLGTLRRSFQAYFPRRQLGKLSLINSEFASLDRTTLHVSFEFIEVHKTNLRSIETGSFDSSIERLRRLEITHNNLEKFPFKDFKSFPNLESLILRYNELKSIPDEALSGHSRLQKIDLSFNKISYIGSNAFKNMGALESLDLRYNKLAVVNNLAFSSSWYSPKYAIDLSNNRIIKMADDAFHSVLPSVLNLTSNNLKDLSERQFGPMMNGMAERGSGLLMLANNRFRCTCESTRWLVQLPWSYKRHVVGFVCSDLKRPLEELTLSDIGCVQPY